MLQVEVMLSWPRPMGAVSFGTVWQDNLFKYWRWTKKSSNKEFGTIWGQKAQECHASLTPFFDLLPYHSFHIWNISLQISEGWEFPAYVSMLFHAFYSPQTSFYSLDFSALLNNSFSAFRIHMVLFLWETLSWTQGLTLCLPFTFPQESWVLSIMQ